MGLRIMRSCPHEQAIFEPLDGRIGLAGGLASEGDGFVSRHGQVDRILDDPWHGSDGNDGGG